MNDIEQHQRRSVKDITAGLNLSQVAVTLPPPRPAVSNRANTVNLPTLSSQSNGHPNQPDAASRPKILPPQTINRPGVTPSNGSKPAPPPLLPPRRISTARSGDTPPLPPRRPSAALSRCDSQESTASAVSTVSVFSKDTARTSKARTPSVNESRIRVSLFEPASLPPLPPKKRTQGQKAGDSSVEVPFEGTTSISAVLVTEAPPPALPKRRDTPEPPRMPPRRLPPPELPVLPLRPRITHADSLPVPPPVPLSSRPVLSTIHATKPTNLKSVVAARPASTFSCLICRDFSGPDTHSTKFPRHAVLSLDWLAMALTAPFPSLTDKARALFTWCHHNVDYDVKAFFGGSIQAPNPSSILENGLAVCSGYSSIYNALALKAGLECVVVNGYGKGYGHIPLKLGDPIPPESANHAWNAVKIDEGRWKLIDACWGAGNVQGPRQYERAFKPAQFTASNMAFGRTHFPQDRAMLHREDGRVLSWREYMVGDNGSAEPVRVFTLAGSEGVSDADFLPRASHLPVSSQAEPGPRVRFQFQRVCPHWDPVVHGRGRDFVYVLALAVPVEGGFPPDIVPFETNGHLWRVDVEPGRLGRAGEKVQAWAVDTIDGRSGRGMPVDEYVSARGKKAMGFQVLAEWLLG